MGLRLQPTEKRSSATVAVYNASYRDLIAGSSGAVPALIKATVRYKYRVTKTFTQARLQLPMSRGTNFHPFSLPRQLFEG